MSKTCQSNYKDLSALDLAEEINTPVSTSMLYKNDKNLFFIATSANISKKYHKPNELLDHFTNAELSRNEVYRTTDLEVSTLIEKVLIQKIIRQF